MKLKRKTRAVKRILYPALLLSGIAVLYFVGAYSLNIWPFAKSTTNPTEDEYTTNLEEPTAEQKEAGERVSNQHKVSADEEEPSDSSSPIPIEITSLNQTGDSIAIRTLIHTLAPGTCTLTLSHPSHDEVIKTADSQQLANVSACQGFDVSKTEVSPGDWQVKIEFNSNGTTGTVQQTITVQ